jgi:hypothetical protein
MARARAPHRRHAAVRHPRAPIGQPGVPRWLPVGVIAAVVVLVVFALGRASAGDSSSSSAVSPRSRIPGVGPSRTVHGVPAGYAHSRAGALAAALNYIGVFGNPRVLFNPARLRQALAVVATPQLAQKALGDFRNAANLIAQTPLARSIRSGAPAITVGVPVAYRVTRTAADRLTTQLWTVAVIGDLQGTAPRAIWGRVTISLGWVGGDWKVVAPDRRQDGPTPAVGSTERPTDAGTFVDELQGFRGFRYAP